MQKTNLTHKQNCIVVLFANVGDVIGRLTLSNKDEISGNFREDLQNKKEVI